MPTVLVTGGCGFIGSRTSSATCSRPTRPCASSTSTPSPTPATSANLADLASHPRYTFVKGDITDRDDVRGGDADAASPT